MQYNIYVVKCSKGEICMNRLWYDKATSDWNCALPLGNGFMGAMCFGGTLIDRFQLNNDSVWWGGSRNRINPDAKESIPVIRKLIREGRIIACGDVSQSRITLPSTRCAAAQSGRSVERIFGNGLNQRRGISSSARLS